MQNLKSIRLAEVDNFFKQSFEQKKLIPLYLQQTHVLVFDFAGPVHRNKQNDQNIAGGYGEENNYHIHNT